MIQLFICVIEDCVNKDIEYRIIDPAPIVECGGCKTILEAVNE